LALTYPSGIDIKEGDRITYAEESGRVELLAEQLSGDPSRDWWIESCGGPGILIEVSSGDRFYLWKPEEEEDLIFIARRDEGRGDEDTDPAL
jgi:hypothetical protein